MAQIKTHVNHGSRWSEDEEKAAFSGYRDRKTAEEIAETFPTDRHPESIRMKLGNHKWEDTNGREGLRGGNKWVKARWAYSRRYVVEYHNSALKNLLEEQLSLGQQMRHVRDRIAYHTNRLDEVLTFPN